MLKTYYITVENGNFKKVYKTQATKRTIAEKKVLNEANKWFDGNFSILAVTVEIHNVKFKVNLD